MHPNQQPQPAPYRSTPLPPPPGRPHISFGAVPTAFWVGLAIGAGAFLVKITSRQISSGSDGYSCTYHNYAGFLAAAGIVVCLLIGWAAWTSVRADYRLAVPVMLAISVLMVVLAFVHVLRGTGTIQNPCDAHPLP